MRLARVILVAGILTALGATAVWASGSATVEVQKTKIGKVITDKRGHTLYMFRADHGTVSACYGKCARFWPPLTTVGKPVAGPGVKTALLGTTKRKDGKLQVTYKRHPALRLPRGQEARPDSRRRLQSLRRRLVRTDADRRGHRPGLTPSPEPALPVTPSNRRAARRRR